MNRKYQVEGTYKGKVRLTVMAKDLGEAIKRFQAAEEDEVEVLDPSRIEVDTDKVRPA
jgi:Sec-independent protein translocase protein TatA